MDRGIELHLFNLWLPFVAGYAVIWISMAYANRRRGKPIEDPEMYKLHKPKSMIAAGLLPTASLLLCSIFISIRTDTLFYAGISVFGIGILLNTAASFSFTGFAVGVNITGVYRLSRNPMYAGGFLFILGLNLMGWSVSLMNVIFIALFIIWIAATHWMVLKEESFLEYKYGDTYRAYKRRVPRYVGVVKEK